MRWKDSNFLGKLESFLFWDLGSFAFLVRTMKHVCKLCKKSFLSGRVLGGHMRCHGTKKSAKTEKNIEMCRAHYEVEDDDYAGYGLRVNPKKCWKFSGHSKFEASAGEEKEIVCRCRVCGKGFDSMRAMFGHMKHHSGRERKETQSCEVCGKGFETLRALATHSRCHSKSIRGSDGLETVSSVKSLSLGWCLKKCKCLIPHVTEKLER